MSNEAQMDGAIVAVSPARARSNVAPARRKAPPRSKTDIVLKKLRSAKGISIQQLAEATGWQLHSVRGFLSATVRKKLGLNLISETGKDEVRRYRVVDAAGPAAS